MRLVDADVIEYTMLYKENWLTGTGVEAPAVWKSDVDAMSTIDAVPVVRCRECKHRFVDGDNVRFNVCELNHNKVQSDDWFCADGERKPDLSLPTDTSDRCVCCGEPVPEGRMVCPVCERRANE